MRIRTKILCGIVLFLLQSCGEENEVAVQDDIVPDVPIEDDIEEDDETPSDFVDGLPTPENLIVYDYIDYLSDLPSHYRSNNVEEADNTPFDNRITNHGANLGRVLFYDKRLSINNTISCSSCHKQANGFTDPVALSSGFQGGLTNRHSMSLTNARYYENGRFFWDERAATLEQQVLMPIQDDVEMGMNMGVLEMKLTATSFYPELFENAFGTTEITRERIALSLAQFVRSMVSFNSKYDALLEGQINFTQQETLGRALFEQFPGSNIQSLRCDHCHGTAATISDEPENSGLDANTSQDQGAGGGRFKSPSLRNIGVGAPYMHDGRFDSLEEVIDFYDNGVQNHPNLSNRLELNGMPDRLNLTQNEKSAIVAFLNTLTDNDFLTNPRFGDPFQ